MNELTCKTLDVTELGEQVFRVRLQPLGAELFDFKGGQYLYLLMPDGKRIPLSIASPPQQHQFIELHIRLIPGHPLAADMLHLFKTAKKIPIEGPYGDCHLRAGDKKVVVIAGGTGFSPMKSLLESAFTQRDPRNFSLYLGAQSEKELYQQAIIKRWDTGVCQFRYIPVLQQAVNGWSGATGLPHQVAIDELGQELASVDCYISGSEAMVLHVYKALLAAGADKASIYSDILDIKRQIGEKI